MGKCYAPKPGYQQTQAYQIHHAINIYIAMPLCVIGVIFNVICIVLWNRLMKRAVKKRNITCGIYLTVIAIVDMGALVSFFTSDALLYLWPDLIHSYSYNVFYAYIGYPAHGGFMFVSFWLIAGVDACRLTMILFPIKFRQSENRMTNTSIMLNVFVVFGVNIPNFFAYRVSHTTQGVPCRYMTSLYLSESFQNYVFWFQCVLMSVCPWFVIITVNLIIKVRERLLLKHYISNTFNRTAAEMGKLLFAVSIWFVSLVLVQCVAQCLYLKTTQKNPHWRHVYSMNAFGKLGQVLNSSGKPFLFLLTSRTFRTAFVRMFRDTKSLYGQVSRFAPNDQFNKEKVRLGKTKRRWFGLSVNRIGDATSCTIQVKYMASTIHAQVNYPAEIDSNNLFVTAPTSTHEERDVCKIELNL